jgi:hypothetical protein
MVASPRAKGQETSTAGAARLRGILRDMRRGIRSHILGDIVRDIHRVPHPFTAGRREPPDA